MRKFISKNPFNNKIYKEIDFFQEQEIQQTIRNSYISFETYKKSGLKEKLDRIQMLKNQINQNPDKYAQLISLEMGKPIKQSKLEVQKVLAHCSYYQLNAEKLLKQQLIVTEAKKSYIRYQAIGPIFIITPFNYPFWLPFKSMIPNLVLGNTILLRVSDSTPLLGLAIEELMKNSGFDQNQVQLMFINPNDMDYILSFKEIQGVSFTGSTSSGKIFGTKAAMNLKKSALELGGNDPFIMCEDANIEKAAELAIQARIPNAGQICVAAKRFIIPDSKFDKFVEILKEKLLALKIGDPLEETTELGPLAREDLKERLNLQLSTGYYENKKVIFDMEKDQRNNFEFSGNFYSPKIIEIQHDISQIQDQELFGPIFTLIRYKNIEQAIEIANNTSFGLGAIIVSENKKKAEEISKVIEAGQIFINSVTKSDSRLPSGGIKESGWGRECGVFGLREFSNIKTVWID